jgi:RimJ/RimL family protein N-acetyltransferase
MEQMPYQPERDDAVAIAMAPPSPLHDPRDWRNGLPTIMGTCVTLRELRASDAESLFACLTTDAVARFISPPPTTIEGFSKFIAWTLRQRAAGQYVCFAIVPRGSDVAVGIFQVRSLSLDFQDAEWGFALAHECWGTGMFVEGAELTQAFVFNTIGVKRLEARAAIANGRGNGALRKLGAVQEGVLRQSFTRDGVYYDQALWTILEVEWRRAKAVWTS